MHLVPPVLSSSTPVHVRHSHSEVSVGTLQIGQTKPARERAIVSTLVAVTLFLVSLVFGTLASAVLCHRLDQVGTHLGVSEGLLGLITALGADSPEIASAVTALANGQHDLGKSVILGSNIFNLAWLLGFGAVISGRVTCGRETLLLNVGVALWVTGAVAAQFLFDISPAVIGLLIAMVMLPYILVSALKPAQLRWLRVPGSAAIWFRDAVSGTEVDTGDERHPSSPSWADAVAILPLLGMVVLASIGMVRSAAVLGERWGLSQVVIGALVLATLTGIPNVIAAIRLAIQGRGSAVVSETFNSNSLNLIVGAYVPTLFLTSGALSPTARLSLWWLVGITVLTTILLLRGSLQRRGGGLLIIVYLAFAFVVATR